MKVMFIGDQTVEGGDKSAGVHAFGRLFPVGQEIDVSDMPLDAQKKLAGNGHFIASGTPGEAAPAAAPDKKKK